MVAGSIVAQPHRDAGGAIAAVTASWTLGSEEDGYAVHPVCVASESPGSGCRAGVWPGVRRAGLMRAQFDNGSRSPGISRTEPCLAAGGYSGRHWMALRQWGLQDHLLTISTVLDPPTAPRNSALTRKTERLGNPRGHALRMAGPVQLAGELDDFV